MKKHLRSAVLGSVALLLGAVIFLVARSLWQQSKDDGVQHGLEFLPGVSQHIQDFRRVKVQDGRKVWEVSAEDARYVDADKTIVIRNATMHLYLKDNRVVGLRGTHGRILLDGREVRQVELDGAIEVSLADYVVHTERAVYDHQRRTIVVPGAVDVSGGAVQVRSDAMEVDVRSEKVTLQHHVAMHLQPASLPHGGTDALF